MMQKMETQKGFMTAAAGVLGYAALAVCWGILEYCGILEAGRMGNNAKKCCMQILNDEV